MFDGGLLPAWLSFDPAAGTFSVFYGHVSQAYSIKAGQSGLAAGQQVVIESLLPDPAGSDRELEEVTLKNKGAAPVEVSDWMIRDRSGRIWALSNVGAIEAGQCISVQRQGMPMSLDNDGDEITLVDGQNRPQDTFTYTGSVEGVAIETHH
jgi:hypothetical protein